MPVKDKTIKEALEADIHRIMALTNRDPRMCVSLCDAVMEKAATHGFTCQYTLALQNRAICHGMIGNLTAAHEDFSRCLALAEEYHYPPVQAQSMNGLGNIHYFRGEILEALVAFHRAVAIRRQEANDQGLMVGLNCLGAMHIELGEFEVAVPYLTESLDIAQKIGDRTNEALATINVAQIQRHFGELNTTLTLLHRSLDLLTEDGNRSYLPGALQELARAYTEAGQWARAREFGIQAVAASNELGNTPLGVNALSALARIEAETGRQEEAEALLAQVRIKAECIPSANLIAEICSALGKIRLQQADHSGARQFFLEGLRYAVETQQKPMASELHLALAELYADEGDYRAAFEAHRKHCEFGFAIHAEQSQNRLLAHLGKREAERLQTESEIQRLRNVELADANHQTNLLLEQLQQQTGLLNALTVHDPLTGLYNRRYFDSHVRQTLHSAPQCRWLALAVADLDNFKQINDRFSHATGDAVLRATANIMRNGIGGGDMAFRFGGEEFVLVFPQSKSSDAIGACNRIRFAIATHDWARIHPSLKVTISVGVAVNRSHGTNHYFYDNCLDYLFALADQRLYEAKKSGKNRVV